MADYLKQLQNDIHENAKAHGFWEGADNANIPTKLMLIVSELGEALEEFRHDRMDLYHVGTAVPESSTYVDAHDRVRYEIGGVEVAEQDAMTDRKPEGFGIELADALIRILDLAAYQGLDMAALVELKMEYNRGRPHKHGGRRV